MKLSQYFKSIIDTDSTAIVICDTEHKIIYMNPAACKSYCKSGGHLLIGKSLLECHNAKSGELINQVIDWFKADKRNNRVHTFFNENQNKDVYMVALRDDNGALIGYYEKHEYRSPDTSPLYDLG